MVAADVVKSLCVKTLVVRWVTLKGGTQEWALVGSPVVGGGLLCRGLLELV